MSRSAAARVALARDAQAAQRRLLTLLMASALLLGLATLGGCNTIRGAGQDMEAAGDAVTDTARETQQEGL